MPPITSSTINEGSRYGFPFLGNIDERLSERLDVSSLFNTGLVDANGYLIPGSPLRLVAQELVPVSGASQKVRGLTFEAVKVAKSNSETDLNNADDVDVVVAVIGTVDRAIVENNLGRVLSANEVSAIEDSHLVLSDPET